MTTQAEVHIFRCPENHISMSTERYAVVECDVCGRTAFRLLKDGDGFYCPEHLRQQEWCCARAVPWEVEG